MLTASFNNVYGYIQLHISTIALMKLIKNKLQNKHSLDNFNQ